MIIPLLLTGFDRQRVMLPSHARGTKAGPRKSDRTMQTARLPRTGAHDEEQPCRSGMPCCNYDVDLRT